MFLSIVLILIGYGLGSIASAVIICKVMGLEDPRTLGSKNPGATNVLRQGNKTAAALTLLFDLLKGTLAVSLAQFLTAETWIWSSVAIAAVIGHMFPIFFGFKGGKGVATGLGVFIALSWKVALLLLGTWLIIAATFRYSSLAALITAFCAPFYMYFFSSDLYLLLATSLISLLLMYKHKQNAINLLNGKEPKIGAKKSS